MPSFDVVSEFDMHELSNAVDQASRELTTRFDFKGVKASFEQDNAAVTLASEAEFQLKQLQDIFENKLIKRGIDPQCMEEGKLEKNVAQARITITMRQGLDKELAKKVVKEHIKDAKLKVQSAIQGEKVRVTGKKRDDLQAAIALLKETDIGMPVQFNNFRD